MLDTILSFLTTELNTYLHARTNVDINATVVQSNQLVDEAGKYTHTDDGVTATIINIEEERTFKAQLPEYTYVNGQHRVLEPELKLNLHILFAAKYKIYNEALKYISYVLMYFQAHSCFTSEVSPTLDPRIKKLTVELQSLNYEQLNQIWAFIGGKQLPSVVYKVRMVILQDEVAIAIQPPITQITENLHGQ